MKDNLESLDLAKNNYHKQLQTDFMTESEMILLAIIMIIAFFIWLIWLYNYMSI